MATDSITRRGAALALVEDWYPAVVAYGLAAGVWMVLLGESSQRASVHHGVGHEPWAQDSLHWLLMVAAMVAPFAARQAISVASNGLRRYRTRVVVCYLLGFAGPWMGFSLITAVVTVRLDPPLSLVAVPVLGGVAATWQGSSLRRRGFARCHAPSVFPLRGLSCLAGSCRLGIRGGASCVVMCWASMLLMLALSSPLFMPGLMATHWYEQRPGPNPFPERRWQRPAIAYALVGVGALVAVLYRG